MKFFSVLVRCYGDSVKIIFNSETVTSSFDLGQFIKIILRKKANNNLNIFALLNLLLLLLGSPCQNKAYNTNISIYRQRRTVADNITKVNTNNTITMSLF